jgi:hypothetical protein
VEAEGVKDASTTPDGLTLSLMSLRFSLSLNDAGLEPGFGAATFGQWCTFGATGVSNGSSFEAIFGGSWRENTSIINRLIDLAMDYGYGLRR